MKDKLLFGITESGIMHTDEDPNISLENKFPYSIMLRCLKY